MAFLEQAKCHVGTERFSLLLLEPREVYFQDYSCYYNMNSDKKQHGRLKISSKSVSFDPKSFEHPIIKISFKNIEVIKKCKKDAEHSFNIVVSQYISMKQYNIIAPYEFYQGITVHNFTLIYNSVHDCFVSVGQLQRASTLPRHDQASMIDAIITHKQRSMVFNSCLLDDLYEKIVLTSIADHVTPLINNAGHLVVTDSRLYFQPFNNAAQSPVIKMNLSDITRIIKRRYLQQHKGLEIHCYADECGLDNLDARWRCDDSKTTTTTSLLAIQASLLNACPTDTRYTPGGLGDEALGARQEKSPARAIHSPGRRSGSGGGGAGGGDGGRGAAEKNNSCFGSLRRGESDVDTLGVNAGGAGKEGTKARQTGGLTDSGEAGEGRCRHAGTEGRAGGTRHLFISLDSNETREKLVMFIKNKVKGVRTREMPHEDMLIKWQQRNITNYDYLLYLNSLADRSINDLTQYPVFPWIIKNFTCQQFDLTNPAMFRDLKKPIGAQNEDRLKKLKNRYNDMPDPKFLYGSHYSSPAYVLFFLARVAPEYVLCLHNGKFDQADRMFNSIADTWQNCITSFSNFMELIPEFYGHNSDFLKRNKNVDFGVKQDGGRIGDVELPPWASDADDFTWKMRQALECDYTSANLHHWIDLIFGYKQKGEEAICADNVFYYLTYEGAIDVSSIKEISDRTAIEAQISEFGQIPKQLFTTAHPRRSPMFPSPNLARRVDVCENEFRNLRIKSKNIDNKLLP